MSKKLIDFYFHAGDHADNQSDPHCSTVQQYYPQLNGLTTKITAKTVELKQRKKSKQLFKELF